MKKVILVILLAVLSNGLWSQAALRSKHFNLNKGVAISGYDPVAYFVQNKALEGSKQFSINVEGVGYYFSSASNLALFLKDPKRFEPQYGGWCAYAMGAVNEKVEVDPETFKIKDGKLYLFYHSLLNNTLTKWNQDEAMLKPKADNNWRTLYH